MRKHRGQSPAVREVRAVTNRDANNLTAKNATDHKQLEMAATTPSATGWSPEPQTIGDSTKNITTEIKLGK